MDTQEISMIVENILACLMTKKVLYKVQKCKNWPHNFLYPNLESVMLQVLAFSIFKTFFLMHKTYILSLHSLFWNLLNP